MPPSTTSSRIGASGRVTLVTGICDSDHRPSLPASLLAVTFIADKSGGMADAGGVVIVIDPLEPELEGAVSGPEGYRSRRSWTWRGTVEASGVHRVARWLGAMACVGVLLAGCGSGS